MGVRERHGGGQFIALTLYPNTISLFQFDTYTFSSSVSNLPSSKSVALVLRYSPCVYSSRGCPKT